MNTNQLYEILWNDEITSSYVMAIMPSNALKYLKASHGTRRCKPAKRCKSEYCYIVNCNENSYLRGDMGHWMVLTVHGCDGGGGGSGGGGGGGGAFVTADAAAAGLDVDGVRTTSLNGESNLIEIFDSMGEGTYKGEMMTFISKFRHCVTYSRYLAATNCGYYVLIYVYYRSRKYSPSSVLNMLYEIPDVKSQCLMLYGVANGYTQSSETTG